MTTKAASPDIFPVLRYKNSRAAIDWLGKAFGFETHFAVNNPDGSVGHAELKFGSGMIMFGGASAPDPANPWSTEGGIYVAVDNVDAHYARAKAAGAEIVRDIADTNYGAREYSVRDLDGHLWSFGTYRPK